MFLTDPAPGRTVLGRPRIAGGHLCITSIVVMLDRSESLQPTSAPIDMTLPVWAVPGRSCPADCELDLAYAVQAWRDLVRCVLFLTDASADLAFVPLEDRASQHRLLRLIDERLNAEHNSIKRARLANLAIRARELVSAMMLELSEASEGDLVWRFVTGDIESVTACHVAGCSHEQLLDACRFHGWPP